MDFSNQVSRSEIAVDVKDNKQNAGVSSGGNRELYFHRAPTAEAVFDKVLIGNNHLFF